MNNIKVGLKLSMAFLFLSLLALAMGIYLIAGIIDVDKQADVLYKQGVVPMSLLTKTAEQTVQMQVAARDFRLAENNVQRAAAIRVADAAYEELKGYLNQQMPLALNEEQKSHISGMLRAATNYHNILTTFKNGKLELCPSSGMTLTNFPPAFVEASDKMMDDIHLLIDKKIGYTEQISIDTTSVSSKAIRMSIIILAAVFLLSVGLGIYLTISITGPLKIVVDEIVKMEKGDMTTLTELTRKDEFGMLGQALDGLTIKLRDVFRVLNTDSETMASASEELSTISRELASGAEESVNQSTTVASTTEEMAVNINAMASGAEQASVNANEVAGAAEQMSTNMNTIAAAIEEMSASIAEIASNASEAKMVSENASTKSSEASTAMNKLGSAAKEIGQVTDVIKRIADKTNLLALNATIEAASAGEAGKGFAVVAGEIKELANQSAQSADDIARRIESIQAETGDAITVIRDVAEIIDRIDQSVMTIAGHVEQQTKASNEISSNVSQANIGSKRVASAITEVAKGGHDIARNAAEAAKGATHVSHNVIGVSQAAKGSAQSALQVKQSAEELAKLAGELKSVVAEFKV
ncbi:MAG: methyl-accepting chemotaxis protein [Fibromonadaceae bacterium]|jgi:methyl-accepting chemotaxis protein|nr:methyl-accepting chemotaxis protein [Fibromonadaceae bacterium]